MRPRLIGLAAADEITNNWNPRRRTAPSRPPVIGAGETNARAAREVPLPVWLGRRDRID